MAEQGYNGWTNRATWNLALWLEDHFCSDIREWIKDRKGIKCGSDLRNAVEAVIHDLEMRGWYLEAADGTPMHYLTPDAERFDDADWDEVFDALIGSERGEEPSAED